MNDRRSSRRRYFIITAFGLALIASFFAGRYWEHFTNGRWYRVHDTQTYHSALGSFELRHVTDTTGRPFLDPGTSIVSFQAPMGEVILYRSDRVFQESSPWVGSLQLNGNDVHWSDGQNRYSLHIEQVVPTTQP